MLNVIGAWPTDARAAFWGFVAGLALLIGAAIGYYVDVCRHVRQAAHAVHNHARQRFECDSRLEAHLGEALQQRSKRELRLQPRERRAQTVVDPIPERDMPVRLPTGAENT